MMNDLELTVRELSETYEELSLLYKLSDVLAGMNVDEIAEQVIQEAMSTLDVRTAALLLYDEEAELLFTKSCSGRWESGRVISITDTAIWKAVLDRKPVSILSDANAANPWRSGTDNTMLVCPLIGKNRVIGVIVLADRELKDDFYSNDIKLMMAIASHAALTIENALLYRELEEFLLTAITSLVKALEASSQWTAGHTERVTEYALSIGQSMGLGQKQLEKLKLCSLLHDIGKIAVPKHILDKPSSLTYEEIMEVKRHPLIGCDILGGFKQLQDVVLGIKYHHESWDGSRSLLGLAGDDIPLMARILAVADTFDAMTSDRPYRKRKSSEEARKEIHSLSGKQFDPQVVAAFVDWLSQQHPVAAP